MYVSFLPRPGSSESPAGTATDSPSLGSPWTRWTCRYGAFLGACTYSATQSPGVSPDTCGPALPISQPACLFPSLFLMTLTMLQHRSLQPSGPSAPGPSQPINPNRLNESFEVIRQEFDLLASELGVARTQRDEFESKGTFHFFLPAPRDGWIRWSLSYCQGSVGTKNSCTWLLMILFPTLMSSSRRI